MGDTMKRLNAEVENLKSLQKELQKAVSLRQQLDSQLNENEVVRDEIKILRPEAAIYKAIGPILIKTDLVEAKQNVAKRIEYITAEIQRIDSQILEIETKQDKHRESLQKIQRQFEQDQAKQALRA